MIMMPCDERAANARARRGYARQRACDYSAQDNRACYVYDDTGKMMAPGVLRASSAGAAQILRVYGALC